MTNRVKRIDYKELATTGKRVVKESTASENVTDIDNFNNILDNILLEDTMSEKRKELHIEGQALSIEISDFIEENYMFQFYSDDDINRKMQRIEHLRSKYRKIHIELEMIVGEEYCTTYGKQYTSSVNDIKSYIKALNTHIATKKNDEQKSTGDKMDMKLMFQIDEVNRLISDMEKLYDVNISNESDDNVKRRRDELTINKKEIRKIGEKIQLMYCEKIVDDDLLEKVNSVKMRYEKLLHLKENYSEQLIKLVDERDIDKSELFKVSSLNINLQKFKGYESPMDVFTFQSTFDKIHLKTTPKHLLPDLLKNNFLDGQALILVKCIDDIDEIWIRLKAAYGNCKIMLSKKLDEFSKIEGLWKYKQPSKVVEGLSKIVNLMQDVMKLAKRHKIVNTLYYGDSIDRIYKLCGNERMTRWFSLQCDKTWEGEELWIKLISFLEKDIRINQQKMLHGINHERKPFSNATKNQNHRNFFNNDEFHNADDELTEPNHVYNSNIRNNDVNVKSHKYVRNNEKRRDNHNNKFNANDVHLNDVKSVKCYICDEEDHVATKGPAGTKIIQYFTCKKFVNMAPAERFSELRKRGLCFQCLYPGAQFQHKDGKCQRDFICKHSDHDKYKTKMHVLVCDLHKHLPENKEILEIYKQRCIVKQPVDLPLFSKNIQLTYHTAKDNIIEGGIVDESAIYMLQTIKVDNELYTLFYDSGCGGFVCKADAVKRIGNRARKEYDGPITLGGVGGINTQSQHGIYSVKLPLASHKEAIMTGICLDKITEDFPQYPLTGKVQNDLMKEFKENGGDSKTLPQLPNEVGGNVDFMIGIKYFRYFPEVVFQMTSGLTIYRSHFKNSDDSIGVIGGPHHVFTEIEKHHRLCNHSTSNFVSNQLKLFKNGLQVNPDVHRFELSFNKDLQHDIFFNDAKSTTLSQQIKMFENAEDAGSHISYRCINCRDCKRCKTQNLELMSIREEIEQDQIDKSVSIDPDKCLAIAHLPFIHNPTTKLTPNKNKAMKVLDQQIRKLTKNSSDKNDVIASESKLQKLGYVEYIKNLPDEVRRSLAENNIHNYIPWRAVWKPSSLSTPCRMVFDASQPTSSGYSLNDVLAKGRNNMNKLVEIFIRWRIHQVAFHTDIQKMYNCVKLHENEWCYQRYLWKEDLNPENPVEEKIIKTLIYGVKSSGNQAETGLRKTALISKDEFPEVYRIIMEDVYVDDCLSGDKTQDRTKQRADEIEVVMRRGGFSLKGITMTGNHPLKDLSTDGCSISVAGMSWMSKEDLISLDVKEINFAKKFRGKKTDVIKDVPENLTRRQCTSKVAEIFDLTGMLTPIVATMKLDLHQLVLRKLDWDDCIPENLREIWMNHFETITELNNLKYKRAVVPYDAISLDLQTLCFGDASKVMICTAIYIRFKKKNGSYSCQLIFSRSKLVPENMTQPRAELFAAVTNCHTGEVVKRALKQYHKTDLKFTDSQIVLYWLNNETRALKQWVRNRVLEVHRFSKIDDWRYVTSENMIADLGTRRGAVLNEVDANSEWMNGMQWMTLPEEEFPTYTVAEVKINNSQLDEVKKETFNIFNIHYTKKIPDEVQQRYRFSNYVIDPNKFNFNKVIRILSFVLKFIRQLKRNVSQRASIKSSPSQADVCILDDQSLKEAEDYFYRKATAEIHQFMKPSEYADKTKEVNEILYYSGRILPDDNVTIVGKMTNAMKDLCSTTFFVPAIEKHSPLAYSIINEIHWYDENVMHRGIESVWRYVLKKAFIFDGRRIVKCIKKSCERCRYLEKKRLEVCMGSVSETNLTIAPAFYHCQVDLTGPFDAYSQHHKRTTVKIWLAVFCCNSTYATAIKVMEDYSTTAFIQAFVRFSCQFGYPKLMMSDEGSQIKKSFETVKLNYVNLKQQLKNEFGVNYQLCPVGGHNMNGRVERKIREIKSSIQHIVKSRISIIQWETIVAEIANTINNLPLALGNLVSDFESMDLLTPNRLLMGRNNERCPVGNMIVTSDPRRIFKANETIFNSWFETWLLVHVPKLMIQPKWFKSDEDLKKGDVVIFLKSESSLVSNYQYGMIETVQLSKDNKIRKVHIRYRNHNEKVDRFTYRAVREIVIIHHVDEIDVTNELNNMYLME